MPEWMGWSIFLSLIVMNEIGLGFGWRIRRRLARLVRAFQARIERWEGSVAERMQGLGAFLEEVRTRLEKETAVAGTDMAEFAKRGELAMDKGKQLFRGLAYGALWWVLFCVCLGSPLLAVPLGLAGALCTWHAVAAAVEIFRMLVGPGSRPPTPPDFGEAREASDDDLRDGGLMG